MLDDDWTPTLEDTPFLRLGGQEAAYRLSEAFYDAMSAHEPELARMHDVDAEGRVTGPIRANFGLFLCFWLGGPKDYLERRGHPRLQLRHAPVRIDSGMRDAWLRSMTRALDALEVGGGLRRHLDGRFGQVADFLRNTEDGTPHPTGVQLRHG